MKDLQEVFDQIKDFSREQKEIREEYKDSLLNDAEYETIAEKLEELKTKKKEIETKVQASMGTRYDRLEELKDKLNELKQLQNDIAMTTLMDGKTVEVKDEYNNIYEPVFKVAFKKTSAKAIETETEHEQNL